MKQGKSMEALGLELKRQRLARKDIVTSTSNLSFQTDKDGLSSLYIQKQDRSWDKYRVSDLTHRQIAAKLREKSEKSQRKFLTVPETARYLGLGRSTVYRLLQEGKIPSTRSSSGKKSEVYCIY